MTAIEKLQSLYQQLDSQASAGDDVVADLRKEINNLELAYLKEEVLPQVAASLGAKIKNLRCGLDCSIQFDEEGIINYSFCTTGSMLMIKDSIDAKSCIEAPHLPLHTIESEIEEPKPINARTTSNIRIVDYSEKAIAVYGDTRQLADTFRSIGGYFNARLKDGPGWVFSKKRRAEVEELLAPFGNGDISRDFFDKEENLFTHPGVEIGFPLSEDDWIKLLSNMKCSSNKGIKAPHKAVFVLAIIDNIRKGFIKDKRIYPTVNLADSFKRLWKKYVPAEWPFGDNMYQPFVHLSSERFYSLELVSQRAKYDFNQSWNRTQVLRYFKYGILDESLFILFRNKSFALTAENALLRTYLATNQKPTQYEVVVHKEIASNFVGFLSYLGSLTSQTGRPYSDSSIKLYANSLRGAYVRSIVSQYTPTENIEDISSIETLREIWQKVDSDSINGKANRSVAIAVKMYVDYRASEHDSQDIQNEHIVDSQQSISIKHSSTKSKPIEILSITAEHIHIAEGNPTSMIVQFINEIGPELVADMHINYLGGELVSKTPNPKYIGASKKLNHEYWINTNSSTRTKIEQIKTICNILDINVNFELGNSTIVENHSGTVLSNGRVLFSLNGHTPLNKRQSVLACVRLFMALNPNVPFEVVERNFPPELQGCYGVVAKLAKVNSRVARGYDDDKRYFLDKDKILKAKDGVEFVVCHQWGNQFPKFQEHIRKRFGWTLEEV